MNDYDYYYYNWLDNDAPMHYDRDIDIDEMYDVGVNNNDVD